MNIKIYLEQKTQHMFQFSAQFSAYNLERAYKNTNVSTQTSFQPMSDHEIEVKTRR